MMHINKEFINLLNESLKTEEANIEMKKVNIKREKANIVTRKSELLMCMTGIQMKFMVFWKKQ